MQWMIRPATQVITETIVFLEVNTIKTMYNFISLKGKDVLHEEMGDLALSDTVRMTWTTSGSSGSTHFQPSIGQHGVAHSPRFQCSSGNAATRLGHSTPSGDEQWICKLSLWLECGCPSLHVSVGHASIIFALAAACWHWAVRESFPL